MARNEQLLQVRKCTRFIIAALTVCVFYRFVKEKLSKKRIYDLIDTAIFDFLLQNGDRHHYETFEDNVIWIDNGKGLGNPNIHHLDILAPLYQCCMYV